MKILLIEDEPLKQSEIRQALTTANLGLQAELAERGVNYVPLSENDIAIANSKESALQQLSLGKFDLILLDLLLPRSRDTPDPAQAQLYGYEILNAVRSFSPDSEVVILSNDLQEDRHGLMEFERLLFSSEIASLPDDLLWKGAYTPELLQRKIASYLVDLRDKDEARLEFKGIYVPPVGMPSDTRKLLRTLKKISWAAEDGRPLPDIILMGERGSGKATLARAFHLLRPTPIDSGDRRLGFEHVDMKAIYDAGSEDPLEVLVGNTSGERWSLGALPRSTFYMRGGHWLRLPGQEVQEEGRRSYTIGGMPNPRLYPHSSDKLDFSASGTVYLENPYGTDSKVNSELDRILGPDLDRRYVTTRGRPPVRLHVGPCVVLGVTTGTRADGAKGRGVIDLPVPQVGQVVVQLRPLRERSMEEKIWLLEVLVNRRRRLAKVKDSPPNSDDPIHLDASMESLVGELMFFRDNLDDLQAIANQVLPEEKSISWRHLRRLWERDRQLAQMWHSNKKKGTTGKNVENIDN